MPKIEDKDNAMTGLQIVKVANDRVAGATYRELAAKYKCSAMSICRTLNREDAKEIIEIGMQQQIALIPKAINVLQETMQDLPVDNPLRLKASQTVLQNTGLTPSHTPSVYIQQIINTQDAPLTDQLSSFQRFLQAERWQAEEAEIVTDCNASPKVGTEQNVKLSDNTTDDQ